MSIRLDTLTGAALEQYIDELARLRIEVFRAYPYLYQGSMAYERQYLKTYLECPQAAIVIARDGTEVIGASSCLPMQFEDTAFQKPFTDLTLTRPVLGDDFSLTQLFYCAESVLDARYRGQGIGVAFFREREAYARALGGFSHICFCAVDRPPDHPLRPDNYVPLDRFWEKRGYRRYPAFQAHYAWQDQGETAETTKTLTFWMKAL